MAPRLTDPQRLVLSLDSSQELRYYGVMEFTRAKELIAKFKGKRIAVIGDLMLDRYIWGTATRISQEAPVPIVRVKKTTSSPGGAGNVLRNLVTLDAFPFAFGVIGDDLAGEELSKLLEAMRVNLDGVIVDSEGPTTEKTRIVASNQQVVRVDTEDVSDISKASRQELLTRLERMSEKLDGIIIQDYAKGMLDQEFFSSIVSIGNDKRLPIAYDPYPSHPFEASGITLATPNRSEAFALVGNYHTNGKLPVADDHALLDVAQKIENLWGAEHLLITLGANGMALFEKGEPVLHVTTQAREVFDVSGAGDTVIATFTLCLLAGASGEEAAIVSNHAAGKVVAKIGTQPVTAEELLTSFESEDWL